MRINWGSSYVRFSLFFLLFRYIFKQLAKYVISGSVRGCPRKSIQIRKISIGFSIGFWFFLRKGGFEGGILPKTYTKSSVGQTGPAMRGFA